MQTQKEEDGMTEEIRISVIIPVYNGERYLRECLDAVQRQTLKDIEVLCIDDGSVDGTYAILKEYERKDPRFHAIHQENAGAARARNYGLTLAKGKYLSFLDADDYFESEMLEKAYEAAEREQAEIVVFRGDRYDDTLEKTVSMAYSIKSRQLPGKNPFSYQDIPDHIFTVFVGWAWDKLYLTDFVRREGLLYQELRTSNDLRFVFSSLVKAKRIYTLEDLLVHHRIHVKGSLSVTREKSWNCFYEAASSMKEELVRTGVYEEVEKGFKNWVLHFCFWNLDTIEGSAYEKVYNLLVGDCEETFGLLKEPEEYYEQKEAYRRLVKMHQCSCLEYLLNESRQQKERADRLSKDLENKKKENRKLLEERKALETSTTFKVGKAVMKVPCKLKRMVKGE